MCINTSTRARQDLDPALMGNLLVAHIGIGPKRNVLWEMQAGRQSGKQAGEAICW